MAVSIVCRLTSLSSSLTSNAQQSVAGQKQGTKIEQGSGIISSLISEKSVTSRWEVSISGSRWGWVSVASGWEVSISDQQVEGVSGQQVGGECQSPAGGRRVSVVNRWEVSVGHQQSSIANRDRHQPLTRRRG